MSDTRTACCNAEVRSDGRRKWCARCLAGYPQYLSLAEPDKPHEWQDVYAFEPGAHIVCECSGCWERIEFPSEVTTDYIRCGCGDRFRVVRVQGGDFQVQRLPFRWTDERVVRAFCASEIQYVRAHIANFKLGDRPVQATVGFERLGAWFHGHGRIPYVENWVMSACEPGNVTRIDLVVEPRTTPQCNTPDRSGIWHVDFERVIGVHEPMRVE